MIAEIAENTIIAKAIASMYGLSLSIQMKNETPAHPR